MAISPTEFFLQELKCGEVSWLFAGMGATLFNQVLHEDYAYVFPLDHLNGLLN
jgi:hypothetical protein